MWLVRFILSCTIFVHLDFRWFCMTADLSFSCISDVLVGGCEDLIYLPAILTGSLSHFVFLVLGFMDTLSVLLSTVP